MILHILVLIDTLAILNDGTSDTLQDLYTLQQRVQLFIEEMPSSGISKCRDPEHFFYGLSGNWEWSTQTADYWRHHFEIPLLHGHNPFRHFFDYNFNSSGPTFRLIDGNQGIG